MVDKCFLSYVTNDNPSHAFIPTSGIFTHFNFSSTAYSKYVYFICYTSHKLNEFLYCLRDTNNICVRLRYCLSIYILE